MTDFSPQSAALSTMLFEANKKSTGAAYLLWFFLGTLGGHRFYCGRSGSATIMLILWILGMLTLIVGVGIFILGILGLWALIDAFLIPGWLQRYNTELAQKMVQ